MTQPRNLIKAILEGSEKFMATHRLYIGTRSTGIVIAPDDRYPSMYRIHWPDRQPSDIVNLTRAKDAAMQWAARQHRQDHGNTAAGLLDFKWKDGKSQ